jgi:hypothetical protein
MTPEHPDLDRLDDDLRQWGRRAPRTSAASAARQVVARLARQAPGPAWPRRVAVATATSLVAAAVWVALVQPPHVTHPTSAVDQPLQLPENVVLFWLDSETPVYFVTGPPDAVRRGSP